VAPDTRHGRTLGPFRKLSRDIGSPLYYAAFCGFYDLAERLIMKHPEQVNAAGGLILAPLPAALSKRHFRVADLLCKHGAVVDVREPMAWTPLHVAAGIPRKRRYHALASQARRKCEYADAFSPDTTTPRSILYESRGRPSATRIQPRHRLTDQYGDTPLHDILSKIGSSPEGKVVEIVRRLLEYGADPNARPRAAQLRYIKPRSDGSLEVTRLLLSYGAKHR
jgi:ankyrin repeat protein